MSVLHVAAAHGFSFRDLFHPLRFWGYQFWSGIGSDVGELALIGGLITLTRHHNCHVKRCWRIGKHQVADTPYKVCRKHHPGIPDDAVTALELQRLHRRGY